MPNQSKNHQENRQSICFLCMQKAERTLTAFLIQKVHELVKSDLDFNDLRVPTGICHTCRKLLKMRSDGDFSRPLPSLYAFETIQIKPQTRLSSTCDCLICKIGKARPYQEQSLSEPKKRGRPATEKNLPQESPLAEKRCTKCLSVIQRGKEHKCTTGTRHQNLLDLVQTDPLGAEQIATAVISNKEASPHGTVRLSQGTGGKLYPVTPGPSTKNSTETGLITTKDLVQVQLNTGLSNTGMRKLVSTLNVASSSKIVEPHFQKKFSEAGKALLDYFSVSKIVVSKNNDQEERTIVHCTNLCSLVQEVLKVRNYSSENLIKLGIDGGGGFLKMSLGVIDISSKQEENDESKSPIQKSYRLLTKSLAQDTGVKRQLLIAIGEDVPESYDNLKKILHLIDLSNVYFVISCDLKVANILCGIQAHSSKHPCCWCNVSSDSLQNCGSPRTFQTLADQYHNFIAAGGQLSKAKEFDNVVHPSLLEIPGSTLIIDVIPPMELHLMLGIVNHLFQQLQSIWPQCKEWPKKLHIQEQPYHGGHFAGNDCHKLLQNVDLLQQMAENSGAFQIMGFVEILRKFRLVVSSCFGNTLDESYSTKIDDFKNAYLSLNISVTPKAHAVFYHITHFIRRKKTSLGLYSEQATEALHSNFHPHWARYKHNPLHPNYSKQLLNCVVDYNSKHL